MRKREKSRLDKKKSREEGEVQRGRNFLIEYAERIRGAPKGFVPRLVEKEKLKKWPIFTHLSKPRWWAPARDSSKPIAATAKRLKRAFKNVELLRIMISHLLLM